METKKFKVNNSDLHSCVALDSIFFSRFVSLLYNAEAVDAENHSHNNQGVASENASLFLQPLIYDAEASFYFTFRIRQWNHTLMFLSHF